MAIFYLREARMYNEARLEYDQSVILGGVALATQDLAVPINAVARLQGDAAKANAERHANTANLTMAFLAGVYIYNLVDAYFFNKSRHSSLSGDSRNIFFSFHYNTGDTDRTTGIKETRAGFQFHWRF